MIAIYYKSKYRETIKSFLSRFKCSHLSFNASEYSVYYVIDDEIYCTTKTLFKKIFPYVKPKAPEDYEEY